MNTKAGGHNQYLRYFAIIYVILSFIAMFFAALAIGRYPYGYYIAFRWPIFIAAIYASVIYLVLKNYYVMSIFIFFTILFNTIFVVHLGDKGIWMIFDGLVALSFFISSLDINLETKERNGLSNWKILFATIAAVYATFIINGIYSIMYYPAPSYYESEMMSEMWEDVAIFTVIWPTIIAPYWFIHDDLG